LERSNVSPPQDPLADTVLEAHDTDGSGRPVLLLNGMYATQRD
jgi:hypothetical protein